MKNIIMVDLDTEREQKIKITKPDNIVKEISDEKTAKEMVVKDISTLCNGIGALIQVGEDNGYFEAEKLSNLCIKYLTDNFIKKGEDGV